jgi:hypothetical protein
MISIKHVRDITTTSLSDPAGSWTLSKNCRAPF